MNNSILIVGEGLTYGLDQIIKHTSSKIVSNLYGKDSDLTNAFLLSSSIGVKDIYLANIQSQNGLINVCQMASQYNFKYIVPIGIRFSDKAYNKTIGRNMTFAEIALKIVSATSDSIVVMTDNHASLYEDMDSFLDEMDRKIKNFKTSSEGILNNGRQLWFVANNLKGVSFSNVVLASVMSITTLPSYPDYNIPDAVFDIDNADVKNEMIYFKNNFLTNNSIENFVNFHNENTVYKVACIDLVIREINENLDLSLFSGKLFNSQVKLRIQNFTKEYLNSIKGKLIRDYEILNIEAYLNVEMYYDIFVYFKILPVNSLEECKVLIEV